jgi:hypothetical protein
MNADDYLHTIKNLSRIAFEQKPKTSKEKDSFSKINENKSIFNNCLSSIYGNPYSQ